MSPKTAADEVVLGASYETDARPRGIQHIRAIHQLGVLFFDRMDEALPAVSRWHFGLRRHEPMGAFQTIVHDTSARCLTYQQQHIEHITPHFRGNS